MIEYKKNFEAAFSSVLHIMGSDKTHCSNMIVYLYICHRYCLSDKKGVRISYKQIMEDLKLTSSTISKSIESLRELGLIETKSTSIKQRGGCRTLNSFHPVIKLGDKAIQFQSNFQSENQSKKQSPKQSRKQIEAIQKTDCNQSKNQSLSPITLDTNVSNSIEEKEKEKLFRSPSASERESVFSSVVAKDKTTTKKIIKKQSNPPLNEDDHPLFRSKSNNKPSPPSKYDLAATQLYKALKDKHIPINSKSRIANWASSFAKIEQSYDVEWNEVQELLDWYCHNIGKKYVRQIYSGTAFYKEYTELCGNRMNIEGDQEYSDEAYIATQPNPYVKETTPEEQQFKRDAMAHWL